jgi:hypothetical protein
MSEKLFRVLLLMYPRQFRKAHGDEAAQFFRDRYRDERGAFARLRLWLDLICDFAVTVPREYFRPQPVLIATPLQNSLGSAPSFFILRNESPSLSALLSGGALSIFAIGMFSLSLVHFASGTRGIRFAFMEKQRHASVPQKQNAQIGQSGDRNATKSATTQNRTLDAAERRLVIEAAANNLRQYYVYPDLGQQMAESLLAHQNNGDDDAATDPAGFADLLTKQMRVVSHDSHLEIVYSAEPLPTQPGVQTPERAARYRTLMEQQNCTFEKVQMLPHAIGYFKLNSFPELSVCREHAMAAMASLNGAKAIIFDLRDNRGGFPEMVSFIASYLFDHPEYMYNPRENTAKQSWTQSPVPGSKLTDKPVYLLTSGRTMSAAEQFSYDLKMLKRATIVGEKTAGASHSGVFHRINDHFGMGIRESKPVNPFSDTDWEGTGVEPDVQATEAVALDVAEKLALIKLQK